MLRGGKQLTETIERNIDKFKKGKVLNMDLYNRTVNEELSQALTDPTHNSQRLFDGLRIRKLTPCECWALMGFDKSDYERASQVNSNSQLYKQAGNSIVVNVLEAILTNLLIDNKQEITGQTNIYDFIGE
jgi:site-specific DNA-cytosine methylase